jgi:hypothetical protein
MAQQSDHEIECRYDPGFVNAVNKGVGGRRVAGAAQSGRFANVPGHA